MLSELEYKYSERKVIGIWGEIFDVHLNIEMFIYFQINYKGIYSALPQLSI